MTADAVPEHFWRRLPRPCFGLSPMDGVTNAPFRLLTARYGAPDVMYTEFVPVDGLMHNAVTLLRDFVYDPIERPIVAQIYGTNPQWFYAVAHLLCAMGFDGIDINMGCPAKNVAARGAGAGLIRTPELAQSLVRAVQRGIADWCAGQSPAMAGVLPEVIAAARAQCPQWIDDAQASDGRRAIPVSVKTRIGYGENQVHEWIPALLEAQPAALALHGRTLKQMYRGDADWDAIAQATALIKKTDTLALGNGDLQNVSDVARVIADTGVDGVLIGRAVMGNPWFFAALRAWRTDGAAPDTVRTHAELLTVLSEHATALGAFADGRAFGHFHRLVKPYTAGLPDSAALRLQLYHAKTADAVTSVLNTYCAQHVIASDSEAIPQVQSGDCRGPGGPSQ